MTWDVIVVGGGIAGLGSGALLAQKGLRVLVLEASKQVGGRASSRKYKPGFIVDWGIHSIRAGEAGVAPQLFQQLGLPLDVIPLGEGRLFHDDAWCTLPTSVKALLTTPLLSDVDKLKVGDLFRRIMSADPNKLLSTSVAAWLKEQHSSPAIHQIFQLYSGLILIEPDLAVASMGEMLDIMHTILRTGKAAGYPKGGWLSVLTALKQQVEANGEIRLNTQATGIRIINGAVAGIRIGNEQIPCETVIAAVPPSALLSLLPTANSHSKSLIELATQIIPTAGVSIDFGLSEPVTDAPGLIVSIEPFVLGQATSNIDPSVAPPNKQLITFYSPLPPSKIQKKENAKLALDQLEQSIYRMFPECKKPEWIRRLILPVVDGAVPTIHQHRHKRLPLQTEIRGLFLAGDAHQAPGAGGDIAFNAALECASKILENEKL